MTMLALLLAGCGSASGNQQREESGLAQPTPTSIALAASSGSAGHKSVTYPDRPAADPIRVENDPERLYEQVYTQPVRCDEVVQTLGMLYGNCSWPMFGSNTLACIEANGLAMPGSWGPRDFLCKTTSSYDDPVHPDEVTLVNAPERIYTQRVHCRNVTEEFGRIIGDCDWPLFSSGGLDCIEDTSRVTWGDDRYYLCKR